MRELFKLNIGEIECTFVANEDRIYVNIDDGKNTILSTDIDTCTNWQYTEYQDSTLKKYSMVNVVFDPLSDDYSYSYSNDIFRQTKYETSADIISAGQFVTFYTNLIVLLKGELDKYLSNHEHKKLVNGEKEGLKL